MLNPNMEKQVEVAWIATGSEWAAYEVAMESARSSALALADALERYLRKDSNARFHAACDAAGAYTAAIRAAEPYHFGAIPSFGAGEVINLDPHELLAFVRDLRGSECPVVIRDAERTRSEMRFADNGIAGFFTGEVRSMRRFGGPRRKKNECF